MCVHTSQCPHIHVYSIQTLMDKGDRQLRQGGARARKGKGHLAFDSAFVYTA